MRIRLDLPDDVVEQLHAEGQDLSRGALAASGGRHTPAGRRVRTGFASVQLAFSLALLVNALLMVTTVRGLSAVDPGFVADGVTVHHIDLGSLGYTPARALQFVRELETGLSGVPAVMAVSGPTPSGCRTRSTGSATAS